MITMGYYIDKWTGGYLWNERDINSYVAMAPVRIFTLSALIVNRNGDGFTNEDHLSSLPRSKATITVTQPLGVTHPRESVP